jgi:hypothetical protein
MNGHACSVGRWGAGRVASQTGTRVARPCHTRVCQLSYHAQRAAAGCAATRGLTDSHVQPRPRPHGPRYTVHAYLTHRVAVMTYVAHGIGDDRRDETTRVIISAARCKLTFVDSSGRAVRGATTKHATAARRRADAPTPERPVRTPPRPLSRPVNSSTSARHGRSPASREFVRLRACGAKGRRPRGTCRDRHAESNGWACYMRAGVLIAFSSLTGGGAG